MSGYEFQKLSWQEYEEYLIETPLSRIQQVEFKFSNDAKVSYMGFILDGQEDTIFYPPYPHLTENN